ncbi:hypothetical protein M0805_005720 [Coniferiporia weirii]|nr:hypothetical protein M0805_005720 [Coniferiporia weirii]
MAQNLLPTIIYGTAWKKESTAQLVVKAVLQGFRAIDTACQPKHYREDLVGDALQTLYDEHGIKREDIWLQTKFTSIGGQDATKPLPYDPTAPVQEQIRTSVQTSLRNLRTTYLDSYVLHSPLQTLAATRDAWRELGALQDAGVLRRIGVSNAYEVALLEALGAERPVQVVQNRWYEGNDWDKDVVAYCRKHAVMYQSFWTLTGSPSLLNHPVILALAEKLKCTPARVIFRFAQVNSITPLAGSTNEKRMHDGVTADSIELEMNDELESLKRLVFQREAMVSSQYSEERPAETSK